MCIDSPNASVILLPLPLLLLLLLLLFDGSIIKFVPERTRRSDNAAAAQRHGQALSGRLSAARRRRTVIIIIYVVGLTDGPDSGFRTRHVFSIYSVSSWSEEWYTILYRNYIVARIDEADSRFIESIISIAVMAVVRVLSVDKNNLTCKTIPLMLLIGHYSRGPRSTRVSVNHNI